MTEHKISAKKYLAFTAAALCALTLCACTSSGAPSQNGSAGEESLYSGKLRLTELMVKNRAVLTDENGDFPDWIELENISDEAIDLKGFGLADGEGEDVWLFPDVTIDAGAYLVVYAGGESPTGGELHADFSLSKDETVLLYDPSGALTDSASCFDDEKDVSLALNEAGEWEKTLYPTPGFANTSAGYDAFQASLDTDSPLIISEVVVANFSSLEQEKLGFCDWAELKNVSDSAIDLGEYCLSDDKDDYSLFPLPDMSLAPGDSVIVICEEKDGEADAGYIRAPFSLNASNEQLYLTRAGKVCDFASLRDIPCGGSFGRMSGENGWFYFASPQPKAEKSGGCRRVSAAPSALTADGIFDGVSSVSAELSAVGKIYYTLDGSLPTEKDAEYSGALSFDSTTVLRAVAVEDGALPSRALTQSFIINEGHTLPVVSLAADDPKSFERMYQSKKKDVELPGNLAFYSTDGGFNINCGIDMHGEKSLDELKKNLGVSFRGAYGADTLDYDLFGGEVTSFKNLLLRAGQDQNNSVIRNELLESLALEASDKIFAQHFRYCVLYINGEYRGIYALSEKSDSEQYAAYGGVDEDSVTVIKSPAVIGDDYYETVLAYARENDLTSEAGYDGFCELADIDSLIDWLIIEGWAANTDIYTANVRYGRSDADDGRWRYMLFDMDATLSTPTMIFTNVLKPTSTQSAVFVTPLMKNSAFRERFLTRAGELLSTTLSNENAAARLDELAAEIAPEIERDFELRSKSFASWEYAVENLRDNIVERDWGAKCAAALKSLFGLTDEEAERYFGS